MNTEMRSEAKIAAAISAVYTDLVDTGLLARIVEAGLASAADEIILRSTLLTAQARAQAAWGAVIRSSQGVMTDAESEVYPGKLAMGPR